jgi:hypothetical protein
MKLNINEEEVYLALDDLKDVLKELQITSYSNNLYTELHPDANYDDDISDSDRPIRDFVVLESNNNNTSYKLLNALEEVIRALFEWDYTLEARFDIIIDSELSIIFHKPVVQYEVDVYRYKKFK